MAEFTCFDDFLICEAELEAAYNQSSPRLRAAIKTGIALANFHFQPKAETRLLTRKSQYLGFCEVESATPVDNAFLFFDPSTPPALICAAVTLPMLAGVQEVFVGSEYFTVNALTTLELCGCTNIIKAKLELFKELILKVKLEYSDSRFFGCIPSAAGFANARLIEYTASPSVNICIAPQTKCDTQIIHNLYGNNIHFGQPQENNFYNLIFAETADQKSSTHLILTPDCVGFWLYEGLTPDFYLTRQSRFSKLERYDNELC